MWLDKSQLLAVYNLKNQSFLILDVRNQLRRWKPLQSIGTIRVEFATSQENGLVQYEANTSVQEMILKGLQIKKSPMNIDVNTASNTQNISRDYYLLLNQGGLWL